jgi:hypothetical protein
MDYRDERHALELRRDDLRRERDEMNRKAEELRAAVRDQEAVERELAATEARLAHLDARRASLLENVRVASPCTASWEAMVGDDRARFCGECGKNVYDLSALTRDEATRLIAEHEGSLCIRLYRRADGTVLTADCPTGLRRKRRRLALYGAGAGALTAAAAVTMTTRTMGKMAMPERDPAAEMGEMTIESDTYVPQPLPASAERGLVFLFESDRPHGAPALRWTVYSDGHATLDVEGQPLVTDASATGHAVAQEILALSRELRPEAAGAVPAYADSAVPRRYALFGTGTRQATDADRARLFRLASSLAMTTYNP